ncbi:MAG: hypothetical protein RR928_08390 [Comamonas sp.]|uniref:hypothetical protein n=1 Tax=Comamonas sp. TaxID=34028 RepID=UPI002FC9104A
MSTTTRMRATQKVDIPAFVDSLREFNDGILRIVPSPVDGNKHLGASLRDELKIALQELEKTMSVLRVAAIETPAASDRSNQPDEHDARAALILDSTEAMVRKGQLVTPVEFQELMGWTTRQAVSKAAQSHRIFSLMHRAERYFPAFYADPAYDRRHLESVSKVLGDLPGGSKLQFFLTRKGSLGGETPLQALAAGRVAKVKDVAAAFAQQA